MNIMPGQFNCKNLCEHSGTRFSVRLIHKAFLDILGHGLKAVFQKAVANFDVICVIVLGAVLRLKEYLENHSFSMDEANTALKIVYVPLRQMCRLEGSTVDIMHAYPVLYLQINKWLVQVLGQHELILRFLPIVSGLISLVLFSRISRSMLSKPWSTMALLTFAVSPSLIFYSSILKPYSSDVAIFLLLGILFSEMFNQSRQPWGDVVIVALGALCLLSSFSSFIAILSFGGILFISVFSHDRSKTIRVLVMLAFWFCLMAFYYDYSLKYFFYNAKIMATFSDALFDWTKGSGLLGAWFVRQSRVILENDLQLSALFPEIFLFSGFFYSLTAKKQQFFFWFAPLGVTILLAVFGKYPLGGRTNLFLVPALIVMIFAGVEYVDKIAKRTQLIRLMMLFLCLCMISPSINASIRQFKDVHCQDDIRSAVRFMKKNVRPQDTIFFNNSAQYGLVYYFNTWSQPHEEIKGMKLTDNVMRDGKGPYLLGREQDISFNEKEPRLQWFLGKDIIRIDQTLPQMGDRYERTWILLYSVNSDYVSFLKKFAGKEGKKISETYFPRSSVWLYDLSQSRE